MRATLIAGLTLALLGTAAAHAQGMPAAGMEESKIQRTPRLKGPEPLARKDFDRGVEKLFRAGDSDGNGTITLAELGATIEARKAQMVSQRFAAIDSDRNQAISMAEFSAWQRTIGSAVLDDGASGGRPLGELVAEEVRVAYPDNEEGETLSRVVEPLNAVLLVGANTDYDGGVSLAELLAHEGKRFDQLDGNKDGWLTLDESEKPAGPPPR
jgi:hypothetical protein